MASAYRDECSPRGRIERLWGTLQGRLKSELRIAGAKTSGEANRVLWDLVSTHSAECSPREPGLAYRPGPDGFKSDYERIVSRDNVVRSGKHRLQMMPANCRLSYARTNAEVHERMNGSLAVFYKGQCLLTTLARPEAPVLRARNTVRLVPRASDSPELALCTCSSSRACPGSSMAQILQTAHDGG